MTTPLLDTTKASSPLLSNNYHLHQKVFPFQTPKPNQPNDIENTNMEGLILANPISRPLPFIKLSKHPQSQRRILLPKLYSNYQIQSNDNSFSLFNAPKHKEEKFNEKIRRCLSTFFDNYEKEQYKILNCGEIVNSKQVNHCFYPEENNIHVHHKYKPEEFVYSDKYIEISCLNTHIRMKAGLTRKKGKTSKYDYKANDNSLDKETFRECIQKRDPLTENIYKLKCGKNLLLYRKKQQMILDHNNILKRPCEELKRINDNGLRKIKNKYINNICKEITNAKSTIIDLKQKMLSVLDLGKETFAEVGDPDS
jgi:hypothetical protein